MSQDKNKFATFLIKLFKSLQKTFFAFLNAIGESITSSVHIPDIAVGPIIGSLITALTTLIIGFVTLSNIFSEQFLYRPLQLQDNNANYLLELESYRQKTLQDYLNNTAKLILDYSPQKLQKNHNLLRAITQTTLTAIDGSRKRYLIIFLRDNFLVNKHHNPLASLLEGADLQEAQLNSLNLTSINWQKVDFTKADLSQTKLNKSNFAYAILTEVNFNNADLRGVNLSEATIKDSKFIDACYDRFTSFPANFDLTKAKMRLINTFESCDFIANK